MVEARLRVAGMGVGAVARGAAQLLGRGWSLTGREGLGATCWGARWFAGCAASKGTVAVNAEATRRAQWIGRSHGFSHAAMMMPGTCRRFHEVVARKDFTLANLKPHPGSNKKAIRLGRGRAGKGRSSGRGNKGQRHRGSVPAWFEGGQTPIQRRVPKKIIKKPRSPPLTELNLDKLQQWIDQGRIDTARVITIRDMWLAKLVPTPKSGVIIRGRGNRVFRAKVNIEATMCSEIAADAILQQGGKIKLVYLTRLGLRAHMKPWRWAERRMPLPKFASPKPKYAQFYTEQDEAGIWCRTINKPEDTRYEKPAFGKLADRIIWPTMLALAPGGLKK